ncbi:lipoprotein [Catellatospora sp. TT07R-123]|uniref:hypothetical protein n=1 Tax=Catellatospora sp. TT07R-123 TaxID=2733863 RepID=UPI001B03FF03|nr:hypothetical protein [Catellatospora sp. TT07R-123]GHJ43397.1 lipoprotein [Catellatospora sp. TT07R-123]
MEITRIRRRAWLAAAALLLATAGCATAPSTATPAENNPIGDIPDNQVFVAYTPPEGGYTVKVPEGWSRTEAGGAVRFTDKLNTIVLRSEPAQTAPDAASGRADLVELQRTAKNFTPGEVKTVDRKGGTVLLVTYRADAPADPVTGKIINDDVERYQYFHAGKIISITLSGPHGADNVDPWRIVTDSLAYTP